MDQYSPWQSSSDALDESPMTDAQLQDIFAGTALDDPALDDFADFSKHLPTFVKPAAPCEYCTSKKLDCHMYFGKITCVACDSLFRPCSFAHIGDSAFPSQTGQGILDTLHIVEEDVCTESGTFTGTRPMRSKAGKPDSSRKPAARFSLPAVKALRAWFDAHKEYPYPTEDEKLELERSTGLKPAQIATWLANTRRRTKASPIRTEYPQSAKPATLPIDISNTAETKEWSELDPFERWQHSPPENEPAAFDNILDAINSNKLDQETASSSSSARPAISRSGTSHSALREPSVTSLQTSKESTRSSAVWSHGSGSSFGSFGSFGSGLNGKRDRQRKRKSRLNNLQRGDTDKGKRPFQCTFCTDAFRTKYDWTRHEKTLHLSVEKWTCTPNGPMELDPVKGVPVCAYCRLESPDAAHIETHGHQECMSKGIETRTFFRKDHLRQHLRLVHGCPLVPAMEAWKKSEDNIRSRCGFCDIRFTSWAERNDHIATHFKQGAEMKSWTRCRGLDPEIATQVLNSMPPYLIWNERLTQDPFSASRGPSCCSFMWETIKLHLEEYKNPEHVCNNTREPDRPSCWEILVVTLARFISDQIGSGGPPVTDAAIGAEARRIMFGDDDDWNQTPIDNPSFLMLFKKAYCIDMIPSAINGAANRSPDDLELYADLGMRMPFAAQLAAIPGYSSGPEYHEMPLLASRLRHFANPPTSNPVIYDEDKPSSRNDSLASSKVTPVEQSEPLEFINPDMLGVEWQPELDFSDMFGVV